MLTGQIAKLTSAISATIPPQEIAGDLVLPLVDLNFPVIVSDLEFYADLEDMPVPIPQILQTARAECRRRSRQNRRPRQTGRRPRRLTSGMSLYAGFLRRAWKH